MQNREFYTYALASSMIRGRSNYLDCFWPFVVCSMVPGRGAKVPVVQTELESNYSLKIPQHVVSVLLQVSEKKGYVQHDDRFMYSLTGKGSDYVLNKSTETDVARRVNALLDDISLFFAAHQATIAPDTIESTLLQFIRGNLNLMLPYLNSGSSQNVDEACGELRANERQLLMYAQDADRAKPAHFATLQDLVIGAVLTLLLTTPETSNIRQYQETKMKDCTIYLDTNVALSMLELSRKELSAPALELLSMIRTAGFRLCVLGFTVDEICRLLNGYQNNYNKCPENVRIADIYGDLRQKGRTPEDIRQFVTDIDARLRAIGAEIEYVPTVDLETYTPQRPELVDEISKYKPLQLNRISANHDLAAIDHVLSKRGGSRHGIETCGCIFLTSDLRLAKFNLDLYTHRDTRTVCEVIPDRVLATILWLKNPAGNPPIRAILATYSREIGVQRSVWNRFQKVLSDLQKKGKLTEDDISTIIYDTTIQETLSSVDGKPEQVIDEAYVLEQAKASRKRELQARDAESHEREVQTEKQLRLAREEGQREASQKASEGSAKRAEIQKKAVRSSADGVASSWSKGIGIVLTIVVLLLSILAYLGLRKFNLLEAWRAGSSLLINCLSTWVWKGLYPWMKQTLADRIYNNNAAKLQLLDVECILTMESGHDDTSLIEE